MSPRCSVIITTHQRPRHLALALAAWARQSVRDLEILVADDGSGPDTAAVVQRFAAGAPFPVAHVWHSREGHRRTAILNRALARAQSDYLLFSDGDCLPASDLVAVHLAEREPARLLLGGYVRVDRAGSALADAAWVASGAYEALVTRRARLRLVRRHLRSRWQIALGRRGRPHALALDMSAWRADLVLVNGWDEEFGGWGSADGDLRERLRRAGVRCKSAWTRALVFHLDHPDDPTRRDPSKNRARARRAGAPVFAEQGLVKGGG